MSIQRPASQGNLGKPAPECQTILYFGASRHNGGGGGAKNGTPTRLKLHPVSLQPPIYQHSVFTVQIPFAPPNQQHQITGGIVSHSYSSVRYLHRSRFADVAFLTYGSNGCVVFQPLARVFYLVLLSAAVPVRMLPS